MRSPSPGSESAAQPLPVSGPAASRRPPGPIAAYAASLSLAAAATLGGLGVRDFAGSDVFLLYVIAIAISAWYGGVGPGLLSAALALLGTELFFLEPRYGFAFYSGSDLLRLTGLASVAAIIGYLARTARRLKDDAEARVVEVDKSRRRFERLAETSRILSEKELDPASTLSVLAEHVATAIGDVCVIRLLTEDGKRLDPVAVDHPIPDRRAFAAALIGAALPVGRSYAGRVAETGERIVLAGDAGEDLRRGLAEDVRPYFDRYGIRGLMVVPLRGRERLLGTIFVARDGDGRPYAAEDRELLEDVAVRAALAIENALLHRRVERAVQLRDEVISILSHDLRQPLNVIQMSCALVEVPRIDEAARRQRLDLIRSSAATMQRLVDDLLDVTRLEADRLPVHLRPVPGDALAREAADAYAAAADAAGVELACDVEGALPEVMVDPPRVHQLFANLLDNAIKFTPRGGRIRVSARPAGAVVAFSIADTGVGIAAEDVPRIFDRFWQASRARRAGAGLGLAIAKGIADAHGGRIRVESAPGAGSTFTVELQAVRAPSRTGTA